MPARRRMKDYGNYRPRTTRVAMAIAILLGASPSAGLGHDGDLPGVHLEPALVSLTPNCAFFGPPSCPEPTYVTLTLTYEVPSSGMSTGGGIGVSLGHALDGSYRRDARIPWPDLTSTPEQAGYVTARTSLPDVSASVLVTGGEGAGTEALVLVDGSLPAGETLTVVLGDTRGGGPGLTVPGVPMRTSVLIRENLDGPSGTFFYIDQKYGLDFPVVETHGGNASRFEVIVPSETAIGVEVPVVVRAMAGPDAIQGNASVARTYTGSAAITGPGHVIGLPRSITFRPQDRGVIRVPVTFAEPGLQRLTAATARTASDWRRGALRGTSNPVLVTTGPPADGTRTLWGILHLHTGLSGDGQGEVEDAYISAQEAGLDFLAVSDHCRSPHYEPGRVARLADRFDRPGVFATFPAFEWTNDAEGHRHVIHPDGTAVQAPCEAVSPFATDVELAPTVAQLDDVAARQGAVTILHHTLWRSDRETDGRRFTFGDPLAPPLTQKLLEIYSAHGRSEYHDNQPYLIRNSYRKQMPEDVASSFQDALEEGFRLGVTAGTDGHLADAGSATGINLNSRNVRYSRQGITAVLAPEVSRAAIFDALLRRRTYGTTGARIRLRFTGNGQPMGSIVSGRVAHLRVDVHGTADLSAVVLVRDGSREIARWTPAAEQSSVCLAFNESILRSETSYYVRVEQADEHIAWSSPIWFERGRDPRLENAGPTAILRQDNSMREVTCTDDPPPPGEPSPARVRRR